jgi:hypothetical protein
MFFRQRRGSGQKCSAKTAFREAGSSQHHHTKKEKRAEHVAQLTSPNLDMLKSMRFSGYVAHEGEARPRDHSVVFIRESSASFAASGSAL